MMCLFLHDGVLAVELECEGNTFPKGGEHLPVEKHEGTRVIQFVHLLVRSAVSGYILLLHHHLSLTLLKSGTAVISTAM